MEMEVLWSHATVNAVPLTIHSSVCGRLTAKEQDSHRLRRQADILYNLNFLRCNKAQHGQRRLNICYWASIRHSIV